MENPIHYTDLFEDGLEKKIQDTSAAIEQMHTNLVQMLGDSAKSAKALMKALEEAKVSTDSGKASTKQLALSAQELDERYKNLKKTEQEAAEAARALSATKKDLAKVDAQIIKASNAQEDSYNRLAAVYKLATTALNAMGKAERDTSAYGKQLTKMANEARAAMDAWNKSTGNYTLSVGHYAQGTQDLTKEFNGLNIATQQVLREMPTLANSVQQFFIAISNNVPIFVDNFKRVVTATGSVAKAMKALISTIFSWDTLLLVVLTVLPKIAKAIHDKRKATEEDNAATKESIQLYKLLLEATGDINRKIADSVNKLYTLHRVTQDVNKAMDERLSSARELIRMYPEYLGGYSDEEIAAGKAEVAIKNLTEALVRKAQVEGALDKIKEYTQAIITLREESKKESNIYQEQLDILDEMDRLQEKALKALQNNEKISEADSKRFEELRLQSGIAWELNLEWAASSQGFKDSYSKASKAYRKEVKENLKSAKSEETAYRTRAEQMDTYQQAIDKLIEGTEFSFDELIGGGRKGGAKDKPYDVPDYLWTFMHSIVDSIDDEFSQRLSLVRLSYEEEAFLRVEKEKQLQEIIAKGNDEERAEAIEQLKFLQALSASEYEKYLKARQDAINKYIEETYIEPVQEEYFPSLGEEGIVSTKKKGRGRRGYPNPIEALLAHTEYYGQTDQYGMRVIKEQYQAYSKAINDALQSTIKSMNEWIDARIQMAEAAIDAAKAETDATKQALDYEREARANGYANNVELARKEYEEKLAIQRKAEAEKAKLDRAQRASDTASQISSLITATANIWEAESLKGLLGVPLAGAATAAMWIAFAAAKNMARKAVTYGDGMSEYLDYGGSHSSGHDIDFGHTRDGRPRRVERGEVIGVINKKNVRKYGVGTVTDIIGSLNKGTFEDRYGMAFAGGATISTDLSNVERGLNTLVKQGEKKTIVTNNGVVEYYKNTKKIIHS